MSSNIVDFLTTSNFQQLFTLAKMQGLTAFIWNEVMKNIEQGKLDRSSLPKELKLRWALAAENIVKQYNKRKELSFEFADVMASRGIEVYSLKGLSLSQYYPRPELRECGDFDCWMGDDFQRANTLAAEIGAKYDPYDYRHSQISYKGLTIENHRFFLVLRGNSRNKRLEKYLLEIIASEKKIDGSNIHLPSSQFQAMFTILHMMHHFLYESINLRHLLDWKYLVEKERDNVDWKEFNSKCVEAGVDKFVAAINHICIDHFGLDINGIGLTTDAKYANKIWEDTLYQNALHSSGIENSWQQRYVKLKNVIQQRWKFNEVYNRSMLYSLMQTAYGILFDKDVKFPL